jgi:two-component system, NtrC family, response regulator HydG
MSDSVKETLHLEVDGSRILISRSPAIHRIWAVIQRVAPADVSVLITGETGTGKEIVGRLIHKLSPRASREFVAVDCNAVAPSLLESELFGHERGAFTGAERRRVGVFELADGATLFLDEIANLPLEAQSKLLRVLQEREFRRLGGRQLIRSDFRLITATNADLGASVRAGSFREDLFHRLNVVHVHLPPLRDRREDIALLVSYFIDQKRLRLKRPGVYRVSHEAIDLLSSYDWPGNVRELENVVETAIVECPGDTIEATHLVFGGAPPSPGPSAGDLDLPFRLARQRALATFERLYLLTQLRRYTGRVTLVARHAEITPKYVRELMKRHGISRRDFRPPLRRRLAALSRRREQA